MKAFMDQEFLLETETARELYHNYAEKMPILDYHCHISPMEIAMDQRYENITQLWLSGDHYKWRQMRSNGIEEKYITGEASDWEKFEQWAGTLEKAIGNPLYHWSHLELQRYFNYYGVLNRNTARKVWEHCNEKLRQNDMSARGLILKSNVKLICTTDDPVDDLKWHKQIAQDETFTTQVLPAWRPDRAMNIEKEDYLDYLKRLEEASELHIDSFVTLIEALERRMAYFAENGCCLSDHGLEYVMYHPTEQEEIEHIFSRRLDGMKISREEELKFKTAFMLAMGKAYHRHNWAMQLHYGAKRDNNHAIFSKVGADAGIDCINNYASSGEMADYLNALAVTDELPRTIIYSLNPEDNATIGSIIGCFQDAGVVGKIQQGSAWWFNDHKKGMIEQMTSLASLGLLGNFIGMLTDSRSFLSYTRHEYFRRILCNLIGSWVENGEYPADKEVLSKLVEDISYRNAVRYFGFDL